MNFFKKALISLFAISAVLVGFLFLFQSKTNAACPNPILTKDGSTKGTNKITFHFTIKNCAGTNTARTYKLSADLPGGNNTKWKVSFLGNTVTKSTNKFEVRVAKNATVKFDAVVTPPTNVNKGEHSVIITATRADGNGKANAQVNYFVEEGGGGGGGGGDETACANPKLEQTGVEGIIFKLTITNPCEKENKYKLKADPPGGTNTKWKVQITGTNVSDKDVITVGGLKTDSFNVKVDPPSDVNAGTHKTVFSAVSQSNSNHKATLNLKTVIDTVDECKRQSPTLASAEKDKNGKKGEMITYNVDITNNNPNCIAKNADFAIKVTEKPADWTVKLFKGDGAKLEDGLNIASGNKKLFKVKVTSPESTTNGETVSITIQAIQNKNDNFKNTITLTYTVGNDDQVCIAEEIVPHFECQNQSCVKVDSCGVNSGGCESEGGSCQTDVTPPVCVQSDIPPETGVAPLTVTLHGGGKVGEGDVVGSIDGYQWDFENDGEWDTDVILDPISHVYENPGLYTPKYRVRGNTTWSDICDYKYDVVVDESGTQATFVSFILGLDTIGTTGTSTVALSQNSNKNPTRPERPVIVEVFNDANEKVAEVEGTINYDSDASSPSFGKFTGNVALPSDFISGNYTVKVKTGGYLTKQIPGIQKLTAGKDNLLPLVNLTAGDINSDNSISLTDYGIFISCSFFAKTDEAKESCNADETFAIYSDLNDDGEVNEIDYGYFIQEYSVQEGD